MIALINKSLHYLIAPGKYNTYKKCLLSFILGASIILAFPPIYFVIITPFSFLGLSYIFYKSPTFKIAAVEGFFSGLGFGGAGFYWFYTAVNYVTGNIWFSSLAVLGAAVIIGLLFAGLAFTCYFIPKNSPWLLVIFNTAAWSAFELIRGTLIFGGIPWNMIAEVWDGDIYMLQTASLVGMYGLGFITYFLMSAMLLFFSSITTKKDKLIGLIAIIGLIAGLHIYGYLRIHAYSYVFNTSQKIAIMQPNVKQTDKITGSKDIATLNNLLSLSGKLSRKYPNLLIIWPETTINAFNAPFNYVTSKLENKLYKNAVLVSGIGRNINYSTYYNSALVYSSRNNTLMYYDKNHLVPFGEYIPGGKIFAKNSSLVKDFGFSKGDKNQVFKVDDIPSFQVLICFEAIFPNKKLNNQNINFLINVANDGWYNNSIEPASHLALIRFRSIEGGIPLVRAANNGISAVVDAVGRVTHYLPLNKHGYILTNLPNVYIAKTLFSTIGNNLIILLNFVIVFLLYCNFTRKYFVRQKRIS